MAQVSLHSRRPRGDRDSQTFPEFDPTRELPPPPPAYDSRNFTLSPETTDCDSADLESELSVPSAGEGSYHSSGPRHTSMPILEDGLSSGHASDLDEEVEAHPSALIPGQAPPNLTKRQVTSARDSYIQQLEQLNMRNMEHQLQETRTKTNGQQQHLVTNILAMESITSRLPP